MVTADAEFATELLRQGIGILVGSVRRTPHGEQIEVIGEILDCCKEESPEFRQALFSLLLVARHDSREVDIRAVDE